MDANIENMGKVRRNMEKLMDSSSYACLVIFIILEVVGIICMALLWNWSEDRFYGVVHFIYIINSIIENSIFKSMYCLSY